VKKAVAVRKHLEKNRKDKGFFIDRVKEVIYLKDSVPLDSKFRLILVESRIHRLARYYRTTRKLPPNWKYQSSTASALVA
jgi:small subunit ribosomal protein S13e